MSKKIIIGCFIIGASFFFTCQQVVELDKETNPPAEKELIMYKDSELALLMRKMYKDNLEIRDSIVNGKIPESFPEDFYTIHTAKATEPEKLDETFQALADSYLVNMKSITKAANKEVASRAYNTMINTCASCHKLYCPGPLAKIKKMRIPIEN